MELNKILLEKINEEICKALGVSSSLLETSTSSTYSTGTTNNCAVNMEDLKVALEKCRPEHAILLSAYVPKGIDIYEIENPLPDKYYCKKLLLVNTNYYETLFKKTLEEYGCNIKVYTN
jgi:hypothetical protein